MFSPVSPFHDLGRSGIGAAEAVPIGGVFLGGGEPVWIRRIRLRIGDFGLRIGGGFRGDGLPAGGGADDEGEGEAGEGEGGAGEGAAGLAGGFGRIGELLGEHGDR